MYQYDDPTAVAALPAPAAAGTAGYFTDGNPASGNPATILRSDFMNMLMMELLNIVEAAGETPSKTAYNQVLTSLQTLMQQGGSNYVADTGAANAYAATYAPAITTLKDGMRLYFKAAHANTGASTFSPNGLTASPIYGAAHQPLQGSEIVANGDCELMWNSSLNSGNGAWVLLGCTGGATQVGTAAQSNQAVNFGQALGLGQTLQNMTSSRALGTNYTNSTGKPIFVAVTLLSSSASAATVAISVGGQSIQGSETNASGLSVFVSTIIPPGVTYSVTGTNAALGTWMEMR